MEHLDLLYRVARRMTRDDGTAEDLVQETVLRALRSYQSFDLKEFGIRPWLLRILHNLHATRYQREKRQPMAMDDAKLESAAHSMDGQSGAHTGINLWDGMDEQLARAVTSLPEEYQSVMLLWAVEELSYKEIAESLDVPLGTVMSRLFRARKKLSEQLHDFAVEQGILHENGPRETDQNRIGN